MKTFKSALFYWFHILVSAYAVLLMMLSLESIVARAQPVEQYQITDLERRVASIEILNLDHRLTIMETILNELNTGKIFDRLTMGGTGLLITERVVMVLRKRKEME